ncbi:hypothetical protein A2483_01565 [Candidatus Peregrinibacteria bacterium RIFOXYC2_FULL_33_13]|nr:MAG: hypothetical protein A2229_01930 [Candidatus Peregrinibacteria bacterium RIFOXYA2_FULL_33_7]OGJ56924.1 MAG: hypothetical protein A2483_01565 [Candidatus Peregrinibacteria bacterium RIFOXYC2_FULL_33_13]
MKLIKPTLKFKNSFIKAVMEYQKEGYRYIDLNVYELKNDFPSYLKSLANHEKGINLINYQVPQITFWLVKNTEFIGSTRIRLKLNDRYHKQGGNIGYDIRPSERKKGYGNNLLRLALKKAKKTGLKKALLTCQKDNIASQKIIERNGGIKIKESEKDKHYSPEKTKYWINL